MNHDERVAWWHPEACLVEADKSDEEGNLSWALELRLRAKMAEIVAMPSLHGPRAEYAGILADYGQDRRAEYIYRNLTAEETTQMRIVDRTARERFELFRRDIDWTPSPRDHMITDVDVRTKLSATRFSQTLLRAYWHRGFVYQIDITLGLFQQYYKMLARVAPIQWVDILHIKPLASPSGRYFSWLPSQLFPELWRAMGIEGFTEIAYNSHERATDALRVGCAQLLKDERWRI